MVFSAHSRCPPAPPSRGCAVDSPVAVTHYDGDRSARGGIERRADAFTADVIQIGIAFMQVIGRDNAETFFLTAGIAPAVYRRIIAGRFRAGARDGDADPQGVPA